MISQQSVKGAVLDAATAPPDGKVTKWSLIFHLIGLKDFHRFKIWFLLSDFSSWRSAYQEITLKAIANSSSLLKLNPHRPQHRLLLKELFSSVESSSGEKCSQWGLWILLRNRDVSVSGQTYCCFCKSFKCNSYFTYTPWSISATGFSKSFSELHPNLVPEHKKLKKN